MSWSSYKDGETIGKTGSEQGVILEDEAFGGGVRITLERDARNIPFAITCGIGGWMVHTCYFSTEEQARTAYGQMKCDLVRIYNLIPDAGVDAPQSTYDVLYRELHNFVEHYS